MSDKGSWPQDIPSIAPEEVGKEEKSLTNIMVSVEKQYEIDFDKLVESYPLRKTLRICSWIRRSLHNCTQIRKKREKCPTKYCDIENCKLSWIRRLKNQWKIQSCYQTLKLKLNLRPTSNGILLLTRRPIVNG